MDWKKWDGKKIFVQLKSGAVYSGRVTEITDVGDGTIFISIKDKFGMWVTFVANEIVKIVEEG